MSAFLNVLLYIYYKQQLITKRKGKIYNQKYDIYMSAFVNVLLYIYYKN